jgi:hypothetical protein
MLLRPLFKVPNVECFVLSVFMTLTLVLIMYTGLVEKILILYFLILFLVLMRTKGNLENFEIFKCME